MGAGGLCQSSSQPIFSVVPYSHFIFSSMPVIFHSLFLNMSSLPSLQSCLGLCAPGHPYVFSLSPLVSQVFDFTVCERYRSFRVNDRCWHDRVTLYDMIVSSHANTVILFLEKLYPTLFCLYWSELFC